MREALPDHLSQPIEITEYDPGIPGKDDPPEPHDLVVCIDVLEHIEPDYLDNVLDDLKRVIKLCGFFTIASGPAGKLLPDGRNAHLIQQDMGWWIPKFEKRFVIHSLARVDAGFWITVLNNGH
ncbi:MAG TPA: class I SAM-dependent methyltransferase [Sedimentisphaerales bacterium]|nr:class I SAM-dependent methyltransferase [Sedimentisphaerales bacterium]